MCWVNFFIVGSNFLGFNLNSCLWNVLFYWKQILIKKTLVWIWNVLLYWKQILIIILSLNLKCCFPLKTNSLIIFDLKRCRALALNCATPINPKGADSGDKWAEGRPIRVVRSYKGRKHSTFAPEEGVRLVEDI